MIKRSLGVLIAGVVLICGGLGSQDVQADPALVIQVEGCILPDAVGTLFFIAECEYQFVLNNGRGYLAISGRAQLPDIAVLDKKAVHWTSETLGFLGCFIVGDESHFTVTPKGRVNWWCRAAI